MLKERLESLLLPTRCVSSAELGKVFAMLASLESVVPIAASAIFTSLYNSTTGLGYPWQGSFYFLSAGFTVLGKQTRTPPTHPLFTFSLVD